MISNGGELPLDMSHITHSVLLSDQTNQSMIQKAPMTQEAMSKLKKQLNELSDSKDGPVQNETQVDTSLNLSLANFNLSNGGQARPLEFS